MQIFKNLEDARNYLLSMYPEKAAHLQLMMAQEGEVEREGRAGHEADRRHVRAGASASEDR